MDKLDQLRRHYGDGRLDEATDLYHQDRNAPDPEWQLLGALSYWRKGELGQGRNAAERGLSCQPSGDLRAKLHFIYGVILREVGEITQAITQFDACQPAVRLDSPELRAVLWGQLHYNRGLAYMQTNKPDRAIANYLVAIAEFRREHLFGLLTMALLNYCWVAAERGLVDEAQAALDEAWPNCTTGNQPWAKQMHQAHIYMVSDRHTEALHLCEVLHVDPETPPEVLCLATIVIARVAMSKQLWDQAEHMGKVAVELACKQPVSADSRCLSLASQVLREAREMRAKTRGA